MKSVFYPALFLLAAVFLPAQDSGGPLLLPLKRLSLFSSGVGYFEHSGTVSGNARIKLSFGRNALNDALKSMVINDAESGAPQVSYPSDSTLQRTLQTLRIDLSGEPGLAEMLRSIIGTEIIARVRGNSGQAEEIRGRVTAVDYGIEAVVSGEASGFITLATANGLRTFELARLSGFTFTDDAVQGDLSRALDLINASRTARTREINVELSGKRKREVTISYVIPTPVWKISYRLDLNKGSPVLQAWAIIDNDGDIDWNGVEVSLVSGRPVSFIQELYPPYYTNRPILPLAGAGFAEAQTYDQGWTDGMAQAEPPVTLDMAENAVRDEDGAARSGMRAKRALSPSPAQGYGGVAGGASIAAAQSRAAAEQFEFTLKKPVKLARQQSAMLPLFDGNIKARKILVFSGQKAALHPINPSIGAELTNSTGIKLPAGSITVFDGGTYSGDALLEFTGAGDKRIVSYGEDLSVTGSAKADFERHIDTIKISKGLVTLNRKLRIGRTYTLRNSSSDTKRLIIEHPLTNGAALIQPSTFSEQTASLYRFEAELRGNEILVFEVIEESPITDRIMLVNLPVATLLSYADNSEIPERIRAVFHEALRYKNAAEDAKKLVSELEKDRSFLVSEQERIRANLTAAGNQTPEGKNYLSQLASLDEKISSKNASIETARRAANDALTAFENYIAGLEL
ncbi:MAG: DUF4139 domain-containing protein [Spirochaetaceae bacterium]|jgi:hypothetical protein|nr:DUF4139 domain-containing protein [Spirochaetaceae bacterium]